MLSRPTPRLLLLAFVCLLLTLPASAMLTRDEAVQAVIDHVILAGGNGDEVIAYAPQDMLYPGSVVEPYDMFTEPYPGMAMDIQKPTWFVWIDDEAPARFVHHTRYVFVDAEHPNPVPGDGIDVAVQGWWPLIDGDAYYDTRAEQMSSPDIVWGTYPEGRRQLVSRPGTGLSAVITGAVEPSASIDAGLSLIELTTPKKCAIVTSGSPGAEFDGDVDDLVNSYQMNAGVPAANIQSKKNATKAEIEAMIAKANKDGCTKVYFSLGSHGGKEKVKLKDGIITSDQLAAMLKKIKAAHVCVVLEFCNSGSFVDNIKACPGQVVDVTTATDADHTSCAWARRDNSDGNSYFIEDLIKCWGDSDADGPDAGSDVSQKEAYDWVKTHGGGTTRGQNPLHRTHDLDGEPDPVPVHSLVTGTSF